MKDCMRGCITELDFEEADRCFPGIGEFYRTLAKKPSTFLELAWRYLEATRRGGDDPAPVPKSPQP